MHGFILWCLKHDVSYIDFEGAFSLKGKGWRKVQPWTISCVIEVVACMRKCNHGRDCV